MDSDTVTPHTTDADIEALMSGAVDPSAKLLETVVSGRRNELSKHRPRRAHSRLRKHRTVQPIWAPRSELHRSDKELLRIRLQYDKASAERTSCSSKMPVVLSASMDIVETSCLAAWNLGLLANGGAELYVDPRHKGDVDVTYILMFYGGLILVNAVHAWSFFNMLDQVGAVSSAVMKGAQVVLVFATSVVFFCQFQASQCFSWSKAIAVAVVVAGLLIYAYSTSHDKASPPKPPAATKLPAPKPELM